MKLYGITAPSKDSYNDLIQPHEVKRFEEDIMINNNELILEINPHSVNVLVLTY